MRRANVRKTFGLIFFVFLTMILAGWWYLWNKPHRNVHDESGISISADSLFNHFIRNEAEANTLFTDKTLVVQGIVREKSKNLSGQELIILETNDPVSGIAATFKTTSTNNISPGDKIEIKGICSGYTSDVVLRDCILNH